MRCSPAEVLICPAVLYLFVTFTSFPCDLYPTLKFDCLTFNCFAPMRVARKQIWFASIISSFEVDTCIESRGCFAHKKINYRVLAHVFVTSHFAGQDRSQTFEKLCNHLQLIQQGSVSPYKNQKSSHSWCDMTNSKMFEYTRKRSLILSSNACGMIESVPVRSCLLKGSVANEFFLQIFRLWNWKLA